MEFFALFKMMTYSASSSYWNIVVFGKIPLILSFYHSVYGLRRKSQFVNLQISKSSEKSEFV